MGARCKTMANSWGVGPCVGELIYGILVALAPEQVRLDVEAVQQAFQERGGDGRTIDAQQATGLHVDLHIRLLRATGAATSPPL